MSTTKPSTVLVVLDCGAREADVLRTLPSLAGVSAPEVLGLFIEDEDLLGAARLPGTVEISVTDLRTAQLDPERIAQDLATQAASAQRIERPFQLPELEGMIAEARISRRPDVVLTLDGRILQGSAADDVDVDRAGMDAEGRVVYRYRKLEIYLVQVDVYRRRYQPEP